MASDLVVVHTGLEPKATGGAPKLPLIDVSEGTLVVAGDPVTDRHSVRERWRILSAPSVEDA